MPHPPGALKTTEEVKQAIARQGHVYGFIAASRVSPITKFTRATEIPEWWNLDGRPVYEDDRYDFLFANYFHAFAYACKIKAQFSAEKRVKA